MCCRCNNRRRTTSGDCYDEGEDIKIFPRRRATNGEDTDVYPNIRRGAFKRMAQIFLLGS
jgi:hypothetical protein